MTLLTDPAPQAVAAALRAGADDAAGPAVALEEIVARVGSALRRRLAALAPLPVSELLPGQLAPALFASRLREEVARATRYSLSLALVQAEIAGFESRAAQLGEAWAERLLEEIAEVLRAVLRVPDFTCRSGRAAFLIALPETDRTGALALIGRWRRALELRLSGQGVTIHAGLSSLPQPVVPDASELLASAGSDLERARRIGD